MATITPDEGLEFTAETLIGASGVDNWQMFQIAVGTGSTSPSTSDTQLDTESYRGDETDSNINFSDTSATGEITAKISISGGTEVPANTTVREFGIFAADPSDAPADDTADAKDRLLHREVRSSGVTLKSGDRKTFEITYTVEAQ